MVKRRREESDSDEDTAIEATRRTVFIDTDLDTHLALVVSGSDTVSDLKKKIMLEHLKCFPEKRDLIIFSVKVQRRGHYYALPDTMLVRSAFEGIKKSWFFYAETSSSQCSGNERGLLCLTYPQTEADNLCPSDSLKAMAKQKVSDTSKSYPVPGNLASSSIVKQKEVFKVTGKTSQSGTIVSKVKKLGSKESSRGSTEVNYRDVLTTAIPQNSTADGSIKAALEQTLEDKSVTTDTTHKKKKRKGMDSSMCHDEVAARGSQQIDNLVPNADSTIHVTPSGMKETSPVKHCMSEKECLAPVKDFNNINLDGAPVHESNVSGANEPKTDVANTTGEQKEPTPHCDFEVLMNEKLSNASTKDPPPSYQLPDSQRESENSSRRKKSKSRKSAPRHGLDIKDIADASQNVCASGRDKVHHDSPSDATTKVGSIVQKTDVDHRNEIGKEGKLSITQGAGSLPSDNNIVTTAAIEQIVSAEKALDGEGSTYSGKSRRKKQKKKSLKEFAEKIPNKLDGEDETRVKCLSLAAGIGPTTDPVSDQSKKDEISLDARSLQISLSTEVNESSLNKDLVQVKFATSKSSEYAKEGMNTKAVETVSAIPPDLKVAEAHRKSKKKRTKKEVPAHTDDVSGASTAMHSPPANHVIQEGNQEKTAPCKSSDHAKAELTTKAVEIVSMAPFDLNVAEGHGNSGRSKKRTKKKVTAHTDDVSGAPTAMHTTPGNHLVQESNEDKTVLLSTERKGASGQESNSAYAAGSHQEVEKGASEQESKSAYAAGSHQEVEKETCFEAEILPIEDKGNDVEHLQLNHTDKNQETVSLVEKELKRKTKSQKTSKKSKSTVIQDKEVGILELAAAGSHQEVEKATCIEAEILPIEDKGNDVERLRLNETDKNQETVSLVERKKKTKKSQNTSKKSKSKHIQDQEVGVLELAAVNDNQRDVSPLPESIEVNVSAKNSYLDQLNVTLENQKNPGVDSNSKSSGKDLRNTDLFRMPSHPLAKGTLREMHEHEVSTDQSGSKNIKQYFIPGQQQGEHEPEVNADKSGSINFKQYFIPGQQQSEVSAGKPLKSNKDSKDGRKSKKDRVNSKGTLGDSSTSRAELTVPSPSSAKKHQTLEEAGKLATFDAPAYKENKEAMDESMSSSSSKGSDRSPEKRKHEADSEIQSLATRNTILRAGDLEDCTQPKIGFLPTSGPNFGDSRSRSSDRKGEYSDCSTETPSDYSSSSGYSGEGSEISQASTPKGANGAKHEHAGAKHKVKSNFLSPDVTIDMILRSSSRFKKAKVTAAQCQEEESPPVDVVPDSLPNV